jgi:hypothetical protein
MGDGSDSSDELVQALRLAFGNYAAELARRPPTQHVQTAADMIELLVLVRKTALQLGVDLVAAAQQSPTNLDDSASK